MSFEQWWETQWTKTSGTPILDEAFKELSLRAWNAALESVKTIVPCIHYEHCMEHGTKCPKEKSEKYNCSDFIRKKEVEI